MLTQILALVLIAQTPATLPAWDGASEAERHGDWEEVVEVTGLQRWLPDFCLSKSNQVGRQKFFAKEALVAAQKAVTEADIRSVTEAIAATELADKAKAKVIKMQIAYDELRQKTLAAEEAATAAGVQVAEGESRWWPSFVSSAKYVAEKDLIAARNADKAAVADLEKAKADRDMVIAEAHSLRLRVKPSLREYMATVSRR